MVEQLNYHDADTTVNLSNAFHRRPDVLDRYNLHLLRRRRKHSPISVQVSRSETAESLEKSTKNLQNPTENPHPPASSHIGGDDDVISLLNAQLSTISRQITQTTDPDQIQELSKAATLLRRYRKNELSSRRLRLWHRQHRVKPRRREKKSDQFTHQFDPVRLFGFLQKLVNEHPSRARTTARKMGIDDLDEAMSILGQILNDPEKLRLAEPTIFNVRGRVIDPTRPYPI